MSDSPQYQQVRSALAKVLREASGFELDELNPNGTFLELGFDSLFLIQFSQRIKGALGVKVTFRQLIEEMPTMDSLLAYLVKNASLKTPTPSAKLPSGVEPSKAESGRVEPSRVEPSGVEPSGVEPSRVGIATASVSGVPSPPAVVVESTLQSQARSDSKPAANPPAAAAATAVAPTPLPPNTLPLVTAPPPVAVVSGSSQSFYRDIPAPSGGGLERILFQQNQLMMMQLQMLRERRSLGQPEGPRVVEPQTHSAAQVQPAAQVSSVAQVSSAPQTPSAAQCSEVVHAGNQQLSIVSTSTPVEIASQALSTRDSAPTVASPEIPGSGPKKVFERFGPYKPVRRSATGGLTESQQKHLDDFIARYTRRTDRSRSHAQKYRDRFADPRGVAGYRRIWKSMVYQICVQRSAGSKLWDIDGNEYIDIAMGFGLNLFGQSPSFVTQALHEQLDRGVEVGPQSTLAGEVAKMLCEFSRMDRVTFCNTGSEAVMAAMRIARTVTGKTKCVFFNKDYHGNFDQVLLRSGSKGGKAGSSPAAPGVPQFYADHTIVLEYGSEAALQVLEQHADEIAAVLVEPVQSADPDLHPKEFLQRLRQLTRQHNIVMVMDEVISGFRAAPGGAQEYFDVWGDMATYGKILGGGLPIGALAGKAEYMDALDGGTWKYEDGSEPEADMTFFAGTFVRHPLAMTAAHQILSRVRSEGPALQRTLDRKTAWLADEINQFFVAEGYPIRVARFTSLFRFIFPPDLEYADMLYFHLLDRGIFTRGWGDNCFLSTEHSDQDIQRIIDAVKDSCRELRRAGFLPGGDDEPESRKTMQSAPQISETVRSSPTRDVPCAVSSPALATTFRASTVEEIQTEGELPPLFCMPAADGLTLVYHELSDCLGSNQPVYGLNSPGVYGEPLPETIEEMAQRFVADMQEIWPDGPYLLAGYCSGGTIALEVAQQLIAQGKQVAFLAGVETYNWGTAQSSQLTPWIKFVYQIQRIDFHFRNFLLLPGADQRKFLKSKWSAFRARTKVWHGMFKNLWGRSSGKSASPGAVNQADIWRQHDAQADRYRPQVYPGKIHLFRPKKDYSSYIAKEELRAERGVEIVRMPVYPAGLMVRPYVSQLAELFEQGIREGLAEVQWEPSLSPQSSSGSDSLLRLHVAG